METLHQTQSASVAREKVNVYMRQVYNCMTGGLLVTSFSAYAVASSPAVYELLLGNMMGLIVLAIAVIGLPFYLQSRMSTLSAGAATGMFVLYSALMGAFLSSVLIVYTQTSVVSAFVITAGTFFAMSVYGSVTKRDLTAMGSFMMMGLIGVIIAMVVNIFLQNSMMQMVISALCVIIFTGLTAYDTQSIRKFGEDAPLNDAGAMRRGALLGALTLYLDFINLFLAMLRLFGDRR